MAKSGASKPRSMPRQAMPKARRIQLQRFRPVRHLADGRDAVIGQHAAHALGRAVGPARHQHALARRLQRLQMIGGGLEDIEIAALRVPARSRGPVGRRHRRWSSHSGAWNGDRSRTMLLRQRRLPVGIGQIQRVRLQRLVGRRLDGVSCRPSGAGTARGSRNSPRPAPAAPPWPPPPDGPAAPGSAADNRTACRAAHRTAAANAPCPGSCGRR